MENGPPPIITESPPLLPAQPNKSSSRRFLTVLLSLCLALFVLDGVTSFLDDALILFLHVHAFSLLRGLISLATMFMALGLYGLIGLTPMVPKRVFLPIPMFFLAAMLAMFTLAIFWHHRMEQIAFVISACELVLGIVLMSSCRPVLHSSTAEGGRDAGAPRGAWPLVKPDQLGDKGFSWKHLSAFVAANVFVLLPAVVVYIFVSAAHAVNHFSEGFVHLHPRAFTVQVRKYVRDDGKMIELFPMAHIADASFYQHVSQSFPTNSIILMEGVSDSENLLTNKITYKRMANTLGLSEQKATFAPGRGETVRADVDVKQFSSNTIDFLNLVMLIHSRGVTSENLSKLMNYSPRPDFEERLFDDLLTKRNEHLLGEIKSHLTTSDSIMVPWGAAHMPGLAREIEKDGFRLSETEEYEVIRFGRRGKAANVEQGSEVNR
jgi:hypothetical protein